MPAAPRKAKAEHAYDAPTLGGWQYNSRRLMTSEGNRRLENKNKSSPPAISLDIVNGDQASSY